MKKFCSLIAVTSAMLVVALFMTSCVSTAVEYEDFSGEVASFEDAPIKKVHFSSADLAEWDVLVLDTINTRKTLEMLEANSAALVKYRNKTAAVDSDPKLLVQMQNALLEKTFRSVSYKAELGKEYDAIILRDYWLFIGKKSGKITSTFVSFDFVYEYSDDMQLFVSSTDKPYVRCGFVSSEKQDTVVPYPATASGITEGNEKAIKALEANFSAGIDYLVIQGSDIKKIDETTETEIEEVESSVSSSPKENKSKNVYTGKSEAELMKYRSFREASAGSEAEKEATE